MACINISSSRFGFVIRAMVIARAGIPSAVYTVLSMLISLSQLIQLVLWQRDTALVVCFFKKIHLHLQMADLLIQAILFDLLLQGFIVLASLRFKYAPGSR
jgi:hypothetical protein